MGAADGDFARMMESVPERTIAAAHTLNLDRDKILAENGDDALQRAHPAQRLGRGRGIAPAHRLGPGESAHDGGHRLGQHVDRRAARLFDHREPHAVAILKLFLRQPGLAKEAFQRLRRGGCARSLELLAHRLRLRGQAMGDQREAARRHIRGQPFRLQPRFGQALPEQARQILRRLSLHARGDFLAQQFQQKIGHQRLHPGNFASHAARFFSICASQLPLARSRTRPI